VKESRGTRFAILEGGINHLLRPLLKEQPFPVRVVGKGGPSRPATLAGPHHDLEAVTLPETEAPRTAWVVGQLDQVANELSAMLLEYDEAEA